MVEEEADRRSGKSSERKGRRDRDRNDGHSGARGRIRFPSLRAPQMSMREFENYQDGKFPRGDLRDAYNEYLALYHREF